MKIPKSWTWGFKIHLRNRYLHLKAFSEFDRDVWLKAFKTLIMRIKEKVPHSDIDTEIKLYDGRPYTIGKPGNSPAIL